MKPKINYTKVVEYERMRGRQATEALRACPVGYLPIGCLERHGDHLPMGLDVIKAHQICCLVAQAVGGVVFPPHYYAGIHRLSPEQIQRTTGEWGNLYTDATAQEHLVEVIRQMALAGVRVLVLYSGHYPQCQVEMIEQIAERFQDHPSLTVIPFSEPMILQGDHAGVSETSLMLYLDRSLVDMTSIGERNYRDHGWSEANTPEKASVARGEAEVEKILAHLKARIGEALADLHFIGGRPIEDAVRVRGKV